MVEVVITIVSCIALSASVCACLLCWQESTRTDELERDMANTNLRVLMAETVIRRIDTCPAYENDYKLVEDWRELHDVEDDDGR